MSQLYETTIESEISKSTYFTFIVGKTKTLRQILITVQFSQV